jgi:nucleoside-diphosphate-sugar epimerase
MVSIIKEYFPGIEIKYTPKDKLTPNRGTLCVDKARKTIGYEPQWPLEKGFVKYIEWYKSFCK